MNELKTAIAEAFVLWETIWRPPGNLAIAASVWERVLAEEGISAEQFREASFKLCKGKYWPTPKDVLDLCEEKFILPEHRVWKELPMPEEPPITPEQKREILAQMKHPEAANLLLRVIHGGKDERQEA
jgi:hypothetical protein